MMYRGGDRNAGRNQIEDDRAPGPWVEIIAPELPEGANVEVSIALDIANSQVQERFARLASQWHAETAHLSSTSQMAMHPAYQEIIGMGWAAVPLILADLMQNRGHWFWALRAITGDKPSGPSTGPREMTEASALLGSGKRVPGLTIDDFHQFGERRAYRANGGTVEAYRREPS